MTSLSRVQVNQKAYRCWYKLNQTTVFSVATPPGVTNSAEAQDLVPQGSGGVARTIGLDIGLGLDEVSFGRVKCNPQAFPDDIAQLAECVNTTNTGNIKISQMFDLKGLLCHPTKPTFITIGTKKYKKTKLR